MTICVAVKVSEGLVLASDSASTIIGEELGPGGARPTVFKTYQHARKLAHIKDYPIGVLSWGQALLGARSIESIIKEFEYGLPSVSEEEEKLRLGRLRGENPPDATFKFSVAEITDRLIAHFASFYDPVYGDMPNKPILGMLVSGYSSGQFFPEQWLIEFPSLRQRIHARPDREGKPDFGANWYGATDAIVRLHYGIDNHAYTLLQQHFGLKEEEARALLIRAIQYPVSFDGMPIQEAIDYAEYLVKTVIGRFRFTLGPELCGGDVDIAVVTPQAFTWVQRKSWHGGAPAGRRSVL